MRTMFNLNETNTYNYRTNIDGYFNLKSKEALNKKDIIEVEGNYYKIISVTSDVTLMDTDFPSFYDGVIRAELLKANELVEDNKGTYLMTPELQTTYSEKNKNRIDTARPLKWNNSLYKVMTVEKKQSAEFKGKRFLYTEPYPIINTVPFYPVYETRFDNSRLLVCCCFDFGEAFGKVMQGRSKGHMYHL